MPMARSVVVIESNPEDEQPDTVLYFDKGSGVLRMTRDWEPDYEITLDSASAKLLGFALIDSAKKWEEADQE